MLSPEQIVLFYDELLRREEFKAIPPQRIKIAIKNMAEAYKPDTRKRCEKDGIILNYNDPAHRCAYLHKYAPLHTCLVQDIFHQALEECYVLRNILLSNFKNFNICSIGGGPATDVIGIISACQTFGLVKCSAQVVDLMPGWKKTFNSVVDELRLGSYGKLSQNLKADFLHCSYVASDLLQTVDRKVRKSIRSADLITMVKFVSAATCGDTEGMVKNIFKSMKPGAVVLFIDNAAGGFTKIVSRSAQKYKLVTVFGPLKHLQYTKHEFKVTRYGCASCFETKVTAQIWRKSLQSRRHASNRGFTEYYETFVLIIAMCLIVVYMVRFYT